MTKRAHQNASPTVHVPVMLPEVLSALKAEKGGVYLDVTLGGAGHTKAILDANPHNFVVASDRDPAAVRRAEQSLKKEEQEGRLEIHHASFADLPRLLRNVKFDGVLADLGISTDQLMDKRGFSFNDEGPLDMRMNSEAALTADMVVNGYSESELFQALKRGGVGQEARPVVRAIMAKRPIASTKALAEIVAAAARRYTGGKKVHPATVTFQAIRMEVNGELSQIEALLEAVPGLVKPGARLAVITFHSLEDKLVARRMRDWEGKASMPAWWPGAGAEYEGKDRSLGALLSGKPVTPGEEELKKNQSSRSSRLRIFEFKCK